ncbi:hypothetical protein H4R24_000596 [Coemansia sp. RSA 988]|nr:hypothetical protein H4R24_000596 [Coemansia sp. RSA 988]
MDMLSLSLLPSNRNAFDKVATAVNHIFNNTCVHFRHEFLHDDRNTIFNYEDIDYRPLTRLRTVLPTHVRMILAIVIRYTNLTALTVTNATSECIPAGFPLTELINDDYLVLEPFDSKIETLYIEYRAGFYSQSIMLTVAKYLLLRLPLLRRVMFRNLPRRLFEAFIAKHSETYPHLNRIDMQA